MQGIDANREVPFAPTRPKLGPVRVYDRRHEKNKIFMAMATETHPTCMRFAISA
jgi:hypothetical protein